MIRQDPRVSFPAYFVRARRKSDQRHFVGEAGLSWIRLQHRRGARGAIMVDIDDTLVDGNEAIRFGFEGMLDMYQEASLLFPVHVVTARPDDQHAPVMQLLRKRGFSLPPDRLHMLPAHLYGKGHEHVERFKWECYKKIAREHGGVIARFGDMLWDVAAHDSLHGSLSHIKDGDCYVFADPAMRGTASFKLPGN